MMLSILKFRDDSEAFQTHQKLYIDGIPIGFHWNICFYSLLSHPVKFSRHPPLQSGAAEVALTWRAAAAPGREMPAFPTLLSLQAGITESTRDVSGHKKNVCVLFLLDSTLCWKFQGSKGCNQKCHRMGAYRDTQSEAGFGANGR